MSLRGVNVLRGSSSWPELHIFISSWSTSNSQRICRRPTLLRPTGTLLINQKPGDHNFGILPAHAVGQESEWARFVVCDFVCFRHCYTNMVTYCQHQSCAT